MKRKLAKEVGSDTHIVPNFGSFNKASNLQCLRVYLVLFFQNLHHSNERIDSAIIQDSKSTLVLKFHMNLESNQPCKSSCFPLVDLDLVVGLSFCIVANAAFFVIDFFVAAISS